MQHTSCTPPRLRAAVLAQVACTMGHVVSRLPVSPQFKSLQVRTDINAAGPWVGVLGESPSTPPAAWQVRSSMPPPAVLPTMLPLSLLLEPTPNVPVRPSMWVPPPTDPHLLPALKHKGPHLPVTVSACGCTFIDAAVGVGAVFVFCVVCAVSLVRQRPRSFSRFCARLHAAWSPHHDDENDLLIDQYGAINNSATGWSTRCHQRKDLNYYDLNRRPCDRRGLRPHV
jgi:hypothetical protein